MNDDTMPIQETPTPLTSERTPAIPWGWLRALLFIPGLIPVILIWGGAQVIIMFLSGVQFQSEAETLSHPAGVVMNWIQLLTTLLAIWIFRRFIDRRSMVSLGFSLEAPFGRHLVYGFFWGIGLMGVIFGLTYALGGITVTGSRFPAVELTFLALTLLPAAALEEVIVRGYLLNNLMQSTNRYIALLLTSLLFALLHSFNPNVTILALVNIVLAGLLLGVYYIYRQNLWLPIALHFAWNYFQSPVLGSPVSGAETPSILSLRFAGSDLISGGKFGFEASLVTTAVMIVAILAMHFVCRTKEERSASL